MTDVVTIAFAILGIVLGTVSIAVTAYFGFRSRRVERALAATNRTLDDAKRKLDDTEVKLKSTEAKLDSLLRATVLGKEENAEVVMLPSGKLGVNRTLVAKPGTYQYEGYPATLTVTKRKDSNEEGQDDSTAGE